ncbi:hypothetical protein [Facilibium subflavum]|uniref:hypothetical protein n=1 Tax=Facilibium subflavum TaxID=2219058 RepID=UPI0013C2D1A1|nr:hypothetical protein [Facilibium subflavum]
MELTPNSDNLPMHFYIYEDGLSDFNKASDDELKTRAKIQISMMPKGSYILTCKDFWWNDYVFYARCKDSYGEYKDTSIDLSEYKNKLDDISLSNNNGHLVIDQK